jgi:hypothetical protein
LIRALSSGPSPAIKPGPCCHTLQIPEKATKGAGCSRFAFLQTNLPPPHSPSPVLARGQRRLILRQVQLCPPPSPPDSSAPAPHAVVNQIERYSLNQIERYSLTIRTALPSPAFASKFRSLLTYPYPIDKTKSNSNRNTKTLHHHHLGRPLIHRAPFGTRPAPISCSPPQPIDDAYQ